MESVSSTEVSAMLRVCRWLELVVLFGVIPGLYRLRLIPIHVLVLLLLVTIWAFVLLWRDPGFDRRRLFNVAGLKRVRMRVVVRFLLAAALLTAGVYLFEPSNLFAFPQERPRIWIMVMLLYPLVSVYPQEILYRTFFFHRYRVLFGRDWQLILAAALAFGWVHVIFGNGIAIALTVIGGAMFANTYRRSDSTLACAFEHALYGCWIFTVGLGMYFYHGAAGY
jgi:membrane protease YdiL (CAAX protease family)